MKTVYLECSMGAAGDMLMAALLELYPQRDDFLQQMRSLGLPGVTIQAVSSEKCGIFGTAMQVAVHGEEEESLDVDGKEHHQEHQQHHHHPHHDQEHPHEAVCGHSHPHHDQGHSHEAACGHSHHHHHHHDQEHPHEAVCGHSHHHDQEHSHEAACGHSHPHHGDHPGGNFPAIRQLITQLDLPQKVKEDAVAVYRLLAEAEAKVHNSSLEEVHFHEVGTMDAVTDILGVCLLFHLLSPEKILCSPIATGEGYVRAAHGILSVPAPATAQLLMGMEIYGGDTRGELCTPTGAALLKHFVTAQSSLPPMKITALGYGMGKKDFPKANCVRAFLGETSSRKDQQTLAASSLHALPLLDTPEALHEFLSENRDSSFRDTVVEWTCHIDDMTGEELAFAMEKLREENILDLFLQTAQGKKGRASWILTCLCSPEQETAAAAALLKWTSTRGLRRQLLERSLLISAYEKVSTPYGEIRIKHYVGWGVHKAKAEYDDVASAAKQHGVPFQQVMEGVSHVRTI